MKQSQTIACLVILSGIFSAVFCYADPVYDTLEASIADRLVLSDLYDYAWQKNPAIAGARASWAVSAEDYREGIAYPDLQVMSTIFPRPIETRLGPQDWNLTITQSFPFPGTLNHKGRVLEADSDIARLELDRAVRSVHAAIQSSFYELSYIQQAKILAGANLDLAREMISVGSSLYAGDRAAFYDVAKAQAQLSQIQYDILLLNELEQTEKASLNALLDRDPEAPLGPVAEVPERNVRYTLHEINDMLTDASDEVLIAVKRLEKAGEMTTLARFENFPQFKLGLFYASIGQPSVATPQPNAGDDAMGIQFGFSIPISYGKIRSRIDRAKALETKSEAGKRGAINRVRAETSRIWFKLENAKRLMALYQGQMIPQAQASLQTAEAWFSQGKGSFTDFLELQATLYNFQLSRARALADYGKSLASLEALSGISLDTNPMDKGVSPK
ncbi:MAG: TolC family protein [Pseudomonadota bacterium]